MAAKTRGELIKEARTAAKLTQEKLARAIGVTAADIGKAERGDIDLTDTQLRQIARETGVTQTSLLSAPMGGTKTTAAKAKATQSKPAAKSTGTARPKTTAAKAKPAVPASANTSMKLTATEVKLIEAYRLADGNTKKAATRVLKGDCPDLIKTVLGATGSSSSGSNAVSNLISDTISSLLGGK